MVDDSATPVVSVIVPARNAEDTIGRALEALTRQRVAVPYEVIVVDNGSTDATRTIIERAGGPVRRVAGSGRGPGEARNRGAGGARAGLLAFTDSDCVPTDGWLAAGLRALERFDLVQGKVLPDPAAELRPFDRTLWVTEDHGLHETANLFVTKAVFERVGGFEDWLTPRTGGPLGEDVWFGWRARRSGARPGFCATALVHHAVFPRAPLGYVAERRRLQHFPALARRIPELRRALFFRGVFLNRRSAAFDAAVVAGLLAIARRSALPLAGALPYLLMAARHARRGRSMTAVAVIDLLADLAGMEALARGSITSRSLLI